MRRSAFFLSWLVALCSVGCRSTYGVQELSAESLLEVRWVAYSPGPPYNPFVQPPVPADPAAVERELRVLRAHFDGLVTYGLGLGLDCVPEIAHRLNYRGVILGVWDPRSAEELDAAIRLARSYEEVVAVCVGNEGLTVHHSYNLEDVARAMERLHKEAPGLLCTTSEPILPLYATNERLRALGDFLAPNVHPFFALPPGASMDEAVGWTIEQVRKLAERVPGKAILVKETGWPSGGRDDCTPERQREFWQTLMERKAEWPPGTAFVVFEGTDFPAKARVGQSTEAHWGVFEVGASRPKLVMSVFPVLPGVEQMAAEAAPLGDSPPEELSLKSLVLLSEGVVMVPVREVAEALSAGVEAKGAKVALTYQKRAVVLGEGEDKALVGGGAVRLPAKCRRVGGVFYAPVRVFQLLMDAGILPPKGTQPAIISMGRQRWALPFGSSEQYTVQAWEALDERRYDDALLHAETCLSLYMGAARQQQREKREKDGGLIRWSPWDSEEVKQRIFSYWALNDCAACLFIIGKIHYIRGNRELAEKAFKTIKRELSLAQIWDPNGPWFWSPVVSIEREFPDVDP